MSYTRSFSRRIAVHYSGYVTYPASQNGGSVSYSGTAYEDVYVNVHVDTDPVDSSVAGCNRSVDLLTGAVVATEAAEIKSIRENADRVGNTIISGFYKTIRSDISQQITELKNIVESTLMNLRQLAKRCTDKQLQMQTDYVRICNRYEKIFTELNSELENRIYELDKPTFDFKRLCDSNQTLNSESDMVSTVAVAGKESGALQTQIMASSVKRSAIQAMGKIQNFLFEQKRTNDTITASMTKADTSARVYVPVFYVETADTAKTTNQQVFAPSVVSPSAKLKQELATAHMPQMSDKEAENVQRFFYAQVADEFASHTDEHSQRVRDNIIKMFNK